MRIMIWACAAVLAAVNVAQATNYVELVITRSDDQVFPGNPYYVILGVTLDGAVGATAVDVNGPGGAANLDDDSGDGTQWGLEQSFPSVPAIVAALDGMWTITVTGAISGSMALTLDGSDLDAGDFLDTPTDLYPAHGQTIGPEELFTWTAPSGVTMDHLLLLFIEGDSYGLGAGMTPTATSYDPPDPLPVGDYEWSLGYYLHSSTTDPLTDYQTDGDIEWGNSPYSPQSWPTGYPLLAVGSETIVAFSVVPEPGTASLVLLAVAATATTLQRRRPLKLRA